LLVSNLSAEKVEKFTERNELLVSKPLAHILLDPAIISSNLRTS